MTAINDQQQKDLVRERFTRTAEVFGDFAVAHRVAEAERLAQLLGLRGDERALDLACGPGTLALRFAPHVRWICGLDLTPAILERARRSAAAEGIGNLAFALGDARSLPLADGSVALVVTSYSLHHIPDPARVIQEMARVVRPGGRIGLIDMLVPEDPKAAEFNNCIEKARDASHARTLARNELEMLLSEAGLRLLVSEVGKQTRSFDDWMRVAGWKRGDDAYVKTRRLMEATIAGNDAGFSPRYVAGAPGDEPDIEMTQTSLLITAEKL